MLIHDYLQNHSLQHEEEQDHGCSALLENDASLEFMRFEKLINLFCHTSVLSLHKSFLCFKVVSISDFSSKITHKSLELATDISGTWGERCRKALPWALNGISHENGSLELWTILCQHREQNPKGETPMYNLINLFVCVLLILGTL